MGTTGQSLSDEVEALRQEVAALRRRLEPDPGGTGGATPDDDPPAATDRRGFLRTAKLAAIGGVGVAIGHGVLLPHAAAAADGDPLRVGQVTNATSQTSLVSQGPGLSVGGRGSDGFGLSGASLLSDGVRGESLSQFDGHGVLGTAHSSGGAGVQGVHDQRHGRGVVGVADFEGGLGVGVLGMSRGDAGVYGNGFVAADGVHGHGSDPGVGVRGTNDAPGGDGVLGTTTSGSGVTGRAVSGIGVWAEATGSGLALACVGRALFRYAGRTTIAAGQTSKTVTGIPCDATTVCVATLQTRRPGTYVEAAVVNQANDTITIHLNRAVTQTTTVSYFVCN